MKLQLLAFGLMFGLLLNVGFAQEESLLEDDEEITSEETTAVEEEDLFGGDFFADLDSFLEQEETTEEATTTEDPIIVDDSATEAITETPEEPLTEMSEESTSEEEDLQSSALGFPGNLPGSAEVTFSVTNVSQDNANAMTVGARPGDVLQYAVTLVSETEDVLDYVATVDVSGMMGAVEFTNTGFGVLENGKLVYPAYSSEAPCIQTFTFFVRIKEDCGQLANLPVSNAEAGTVNVALNCGLSETGPTQRFYLMLGLIMLILALGFGFSTRAKTS